MKLDPNRYTASYPFIKRLYDRAMKDGNKEQIEVISELSLASMVPVLAIVMYVEKEYGTSPALQDSTASLTQFYKYTNIVPLE